MVAEDPRRSLSFEFRSHIAVVKGYAQLVVRLLRREDVPRERILSHAETLEEQVGQLELVLTEYLIEERGDDGDGQDPSDTADTTAAG